MSWSKIAQSKNKGALLLNDKNVVISNETDGSSFEEYAEKTKMNITKGKSSQLNKEEALLHNEKPRITGLIIAAGLSSRMIKFKPLLNYNGKTFLSNIIDNLLLVCDEIIVVTGHNGWEIEAEIKNCYLNNSLVKCVHNSNYQDGMFSSIKKGVQAITNNWVLFHQVDQPNLPQKFYGEFIKQINHNYDWIQPQYNNKRGHPILFSQKVAKMIESQNDESTLRVISNSSKVRKKYWHTNFSEILTDIDLPADIKKLKSE